MQYLLYDTAINELYTLLHLQQAYPQNESLFKGTEDASLLDVAPFFFTIDKPLPQELLLNVHISLQRLIIIETKKTLEETCKHFRAFIYQKIKGQNHYFRFWDAQVMKKYLPSCEEWQLQAFLEGIKTILLIEDINADHFLYFENNKNGLQQQQLNRETMAAKTNDFINAKKAIEPTTSSH